MILKIFANIKEVLCKTFPTVVTFSTSIFLMLFYGLENELQTHRGWCTRDDTRGGPLGIVWVNLSFLLSYLGIN